MTDAEPCETCANYRRADKTCARPVRISFSGLVAHNLPAALLRAPRWKSDAGSLDDECGPEGRFWEGTQ